MRKFLYMKLRESAEDNSLNEGLLQKIMDDLPNEEIRERVCKYYGVYTAKGNLKSLLKKAYFVYMRDMGFQKEMDKEKAINTSLCGIIMKGLPLRNITEIDPMEITEEELEDMIEGQSRDIRKIIKMDNIGMSHFRYQGGFEENEDKYEELDEGGG